MNWLKLARKEHPLLDQPITLWSLARVVAERRVYAGRGLATHRRIMRWMIDGLYGVRLESWPALTTRVTTLRKYQDFRRQVARAAPMLRDSACMRMSRFANTAATRSNGCAAICAVRPLRKPCTESWNSSAFLPAHRPCRRPAGLTSFLPRTERYRERHGHRREILPQAAPPFELPTFRFKRWLQ